MTRVLVVSGTGTGIGIGIGKTVVTAAIAALAIARGDLQAVAGGPLAGVIPEGAGALDPAGFLAAAAAGLAGCLGGSRVSSLNGL